MFLKEVFNAHSNGESVVLGSMYSFIKNRMQVNRQNSITSFKHNVGRIKVQ